MRTRMLKPGFFKNDVLCGLQPFARLLFEGLWLLADRDGRLLDRPRMIKAEILPYDDVDCDMLLNELATGGFIRRYSANDKNCIAIINFLKHQSPHPKEPQSDIPPEVNAASNGHSKKGRGKPSKAAASSGNTGASHADTDTDTDTDTEKRSNPAVKPPVSVVCDDEYLRQLEAEPAYQGIEVRHLHAKMIAWCKANGKRPTRRRFVNWLNREDRAFVTEPANPRKPIIP